MKPIVFIDTETTGTDIVEDRICSLSAIKVNPETWAIIEKKKTLINPGIPISPEATKIHGITDDTVKDAPVFERLAKGVHAFLLGCDVGGYNIISFDVPLLAESFVRCGIDWPEKGTLFFDAYKIFAEKERRDLSGAVRFYLGREHEGAHDAEADTIATIEVLQKQVNYYPDLKAMDGLQLSQFCTGTRNLDLAGKIVLNDEGQAVYSFGKDKGKEVKKFPGFGKWMLQNSFPSDTKRVLRSLGVR